MLIVINTVSALNIAAAPLHSNLVGLLEFSSSMVLSTTILLALFLNSDYTDNTQEVRGPSVRTAERGSCDVLAVPCRTAASALELNPPGLALSIPHCS